MQATLHVALTSSHGMACPMPMLESIKWRFWDQDCTKVGAASTVHLQCCDAKSHVQTSQEHELSSDPHSTEHRCAHNTREGDAYVDGAEGPAILSFDMPEPAKHPERVNLRLTMHLGSGADVQYRTHVLDIQIHTSGLPLCAHKSKMDAAWATAERGVATISLRSQVIPCRLEM